MLCLALALEQNAFIIVPEDCVPCAPEIKPEIKPFAFLHFIANVLFS